MLHDSARQHTSLPTGEATATVGWTLLIHPPYSPDLAPSDPHLFGPLMDALRGRRFVETVREESRRFSRGYHATGIERFTHGWEKCVDNGGDFV